MSTWIDPETWYASLPSFYGAAAGLITDPAGRVLLVKPTYRDHWAFPGGYIDAGEYPHDACARELAEELGIHLPVGALPVGALLVVDWAPPAGPRPRPIISLTFDCGTLPNDTTPHLDPGELDDWAFLPPDLAATRLPSNVAPGIHAALHAWQHHDTVYLAAAAQPSHASGGERAPRR